MPDAATAIATGAVKDALRTNTERALAAGVFGVPTLAADGELFWGHDATPMFEAWLDEPALFLRGAHAQLATLPVGTQRPR